MSESHADQPFAVRGWTVDPLRCEVRRDGEVRRLEPKAMAVLTALVRRPGEIIPKGDLIAEVWEGRFVTDDVLTVAVHQLRKALGDSARDPRFIETIPRRGYRWIASRPSDEARKGPHPWRWTAAAAAFVAAVGLGLAVWPGLSSQPGQSDPPETAREAYLRGRYQLSRQTGDSLHKALASFQEAVAGAPEFAPAHAGLADAYSILADLGMVSWEDSLAPAKEAAMTACRLAPDSGQARQAMARVKLIFDWDLEGAVQDALGALRLEPGLPSAHQLVCWVRAAQGRFDEAVGAARAVRRAEPLSISAHSDLAFALNRSGRHREALEVLREALDLDERRVGTHFSIATTLARLDRPEESFDAYRRAFEMSGTAPERVQSYQEAFRSGGIPGFYARWLEHFPEDSPIDRASIQVRLGRKGSALASLEQAWDTRHSGLLWVENDPDFALLRVEDRFRTLMERVRFRRPLASSGSGSSSK